MVRSLQLTSLKAADFADDVETGFAVSVGTDGLWGKSTVESKYILMASIMITDTNLS